MPSAKEQLSALFKRIADAIRAKDGTTEADDKIFPADYPDRITAIETGTDTSDATATPSDIVSGKTAYVDGGKITGTLEAAESGSTLPSVSGSTSVTETSPNLSITTTIDKTILLPGESEIKMEVPLSDFGNASTGDVVSGKTFTSEAGFKKTGTIIQRGVLDVTQTGNVVKVPRGYYSGDVSLTIPAYAHPDPTISRSGGVITATHKQDEGFTPGGTTTATYTLPSAGGISGTLGSTSSSSWSTSDPNRGSGVVSITGVNQTAGYTSGYSNGNLSVTVPANRLLKGRTITPTTYSQLVGNAEDILYSQITVAGDANLTSSNIKSGVSIFGVSGSYTATVQAQDIYISNNEVSIASGWSDYVLKFYYPYGSSDSYFWLSNHIFSVINLYHRTQYANHIVVISRGMMDLFGDGSCYGYVITSDAYGPLCNQIRTLSWSDRTLTIRTGAHIDYTSYSISGSTVLYKK